MELKINTQKSVVFLHINRELSKTNIKKEILLIKSTTKSPEIPFPKEFKDFYNENYKILITEIEKNRNVERNLVFIDWKNCYYFSIHNDELVSLFSAILIKMPMAFFVELEMTILNFIYKKKEARKT